MLAASLSIGAQSSSGASHPRKATQTSGAQASATQQRELLEQLLSRIEQLESTNAKFGDLQKQVDDLKKQLAEANRTATAAQQEASQAHQDLASITGENAESVKKLQSTVEDLKANSVSIIGTIQSEQADIGALKSPEVMHFRHRDYPRRIRGGGNGLAPESDGGRRQHSIFEHSISWPVGRHAVGIQRQRATVARESAGQRQAAEFDFPRIL